MQKRIIILLGTLLIIGALALSGCNQRSNNQGGADNIVAGSLKTCEELNGYICDIGAECDEEWLNAFDTFHCCSCECESSMDESSILTIELFEETPENEDFGDVYE